MNNIIIIVGLVFRIEWDNNNNNDRLMIIMFYIEGTICKANTPDCENDLLTPSDIQTLYNHSKPLKFDTNHNTQALDGILILDNYLNSVGDWCIKLISDNEHLNQQLESGEITGFSLSSSLDTHVCSINGRVGECQYKDYDIVCWQPEYCSFVTHPCNRLGFNELIKLDGGINIDIISKLKELISSYEEEDVKVETNKFSKGLVENHNPASEEKPEEVVEEVATEEPEAKPETTEPEEAKEEPEAESESESEEEAEEESEEDADAEPEDAPAESEEVPEEDNDEVVEVEKSAKSEDEDEDEESADVKKIVKALKNDDGFKEFIIGLVSKPKTDKSDVEAEAKEDNNDKEDKTEDNEESESKSVEDGEEDKPKTTKACKCAKSRTTKVSLGAEVSKSEYNKYDLYKSTGRDATGRKI